MTTAIIIIIIIRIISIKRNPPMTEPTMIEMTLSSSENVDMDLKLENGYKLTTVHYCISVICDLTDMGLTLAHCSILTTE